VGDDPYPKVELLQRFEEAEKQRSGENDDDQSAEAAVARKALGGLGFGRRRRLRLGGELGHECGGFIGQPGS
jgi:hypothetical protein